MSVLDLLPGYVRDEIASGTPWGKSPMRDDLRIIPEAEAAGWLVTFRNNHWHNGAAFKRSKVHVWCTGRDWRRSVVAREADGVERFSRNPETFPFTMAGLREALSLEVEA